MESQSANTQRRKSEEISILKILENEQQKNLILIKRIKSLEKAVKSKCSPLTLIDKTMSYEGSSVKAEREEFLQKLFNENRELKLQLIVMLTSFSILTLHRSRREGCTSW